MARAPGHVVEARILRQVRPVERLEETFPLVIRDRHQADVSGLGRIGPAMAGQHARIAGVLRPRGERRLPQVVDDVERDHRLQHRHVHDLPLAGPFAPDQSGGDGRRQIDAAELVGERVRDEPRLSVGLADQPGNAALALDHVVECRTFAPRAVLVVAGGVGVDDARIAGAHGCRTDAEPFGRGGAHVVDKHIGRLDQPHERLQRVGGFEIQRHAAFAAVEVDEVRGQAARPLRPQHAHGIAGGRLDLDHIGAHVAEHLGRHRAENVDGEIDDPDAGERTLRCPGFRFVHYLASWLRHLIMRRGV